MMVLRSRTADAEERRINVGRTQQGTTSSEKTTRVTGKPAGLDMYEGKLPWKQVQAGNQDFVDAAAEWDALPQKPTGIDKWTWVFHNAAAAQRAANPQTSPLSSPTAASGSGQDGQMLDVLRAMVGSGGGSNEADIVSGYGGLSEQARQRAAQQQAMIDQFYGGAETAAQTRLNDTLARLQSLIGGARTELGTQAAEGTQRIDEATQRVLATLGGQRNPYEGVQATAAPVGESPLMGNLQALGQNTAGLSALQNMFAADAAQNRNATQDMINMLSASNRAAQQSRMGDIEFARAGAQQDLAAAQRAAAQLLTNQQLQGEQAARSAFDEQMANLGQGALQARLAGSGQLGDLLNQYGLGQLQAVMNDRANATTRRDDLLKTLLSAASSGVNVSGLLQLLGGSQ